MECWHHAMEWKLLYGKAFPSIPDVRWSTRALRRQPQHLEGQAPAERFALQPRSRARWQPRLLALARRVGMGVDARSQKQRMLAVRVCDPVNRLIPPRPL